MPGGFPAPPQATESEPKRMAWGTRAVGGAIAVVLVAFLLVLLLGGDPPVLPTQDREPAAPGVAVGLVRVELSSPVDRTDRVDLSWHSTRDLDYAVIIAAEGKPVDVKLADRRTTLTVPVDPTLKYCFMIQATDSERVYESNLVALRGATCRK